MQQQGPAPAPPADDAGARFVSQVLRSTEQVWTDVFRRPGGPTSRRSSCSSSGRWPTACGQGQAAMGPFYCPSDQKVYIDLRFYNVLEKRARRAGRSSRRPTSSPTRSATTCSSSSASWTRSSAARRAAGEAQSNALSVRVELQADCLAGVWADARSREGWRLEPGDIETG